MGSLFVCWLHTITMSVISFDDYQKNPWKNGRGLTLVTVLEPKGANVQTESFLFRVSLNLMYSTCALPNFFGYNRVIVPLSGPVELSHNEESHSTLVKPLKHYTFSGDWLTGAELSECVSCLNITYHSSFAEGHVVVQKVFQMSKPEEAEKEHSIDIDFHHAPVRREDLIDRNEDIEVETFSHCLILFFYCSHKKNPLPGFNIDDQGHPLLEEGCRKDKTPIRAHIHFQHSEEHSVEFELAPLDTLVYPVPAGSADGNTAVTFSVTGLEKPNQLIRFTEGYIIACVVEYANVDLSRCPMEERSHAPREKPKSLFNRDVSQSLAKWQTPPSKRKEEFKRMFSTWKAAPFIPPKISMFRMENPLPPPVTIDKLDISEYSTGMIHTANINIIQNGFGQWETLPVIIARGTEDGPVLGITAAVHGNELNGVPCIHKVLGAINVQRLKGTLIAVPCVNTHGYENYTRYYRDGADLNRTFPGKPQPHGTVSQVFCHSVLNNLFSQFQYHIDLHTASFGRTNSYYVRVDMNDESTAAMAELMFPQILLHNSGQDGTLRGALSSLGIKSITVEVGNPQTFQTNFIDWTYEGVRRVMSYLEMYPASIHCWLPTGMTPILCNGGEWMYTSAGGVLEVFPEVNTILKQGDVVARIRNIFGNIVQQVTAPRDAVCIGRSSNPVAYAGDRIIHLGFPHPPNTPLPDARGENY